MPALGATLSTASIVTILTGSTTWDPGNLANGASENKSVTVTGAAVGDCCDAGLTSVTAAGWRLNATVITANTVSVNLQNATGGAVDLGSGTLTVIVFKL